MTRALVSCLLIVAVPRLGGGSFVAQQLPLTAGPPAPLTTATAGELVPLTLTGERDAPCTAFRVAHLEPDPTGAAPWRLTSSSRQILEDGQATIVGRRGASTLLVLQCEDRPGYALYGPLTWPSRPATDAVRLDVRRTMRGDLPAPSASPPFAMSFGPEPAFSHGAWPSCRLTTSTTWECIGVPMDHTALVVIPQSIGLLYGLAPRLPATVQQVDVRSARWGRVLRVDAPRPAAAEGRQLVARRVRPSLAVPDAIRPRFEIDDRVAVAPVGSQTYWITGHDEALRTVLDISGSDIGRMTIPAAELRDGPPELVMTVQASEPLELRGIVVDGLEEPVAGAVVSLYEGITLERRLDPSQPATVYQRWLADRTTGARGEFVFEGLGRQDYEAIAIHSTLGRGTARDWAGNGRTLLVRLVKPPQIRGRVVRNGRPQAHVPVRLLPASSQLAPGSDPVNYAGAPTAADREGRFTIGLPSQGASQLVIGSAATALLRHPLPEASVMPPVTDLGDLSLPDPTELLVQLDIPAACDLLAAGPVGTPGLSVVRAQAHPSGLLRLDVPETGYWIVSLVCEGRDIALSPPFIRVAESDDGQIVRLQAVVDR